MPQERIPQSLTKYRKQTFPIRNYVIFKTLEFLLGKTLAQLMIVVCIPRRYY